MDLGTTLARNANRYPDKQAIYYGEKVYTYRQLNEEVNRLAHGLLAQGISKSDKIAMLMKNSDMFMIVFYAIMKVGAIAVPINYRLAKAEVKYIIGDSDASVIFFDEEYAAFVAEIGKENQQLLLQVSVNENIVEEQYKLREIMSSNQSEPPVKVNETNNAEILYTSGTTGTPKGALFDHHRILFVALTSSIMMKIGPEDNLLHVAPLFHSAQLNLFMITGTLLGSSQVIHKDFDPVQVLNDIEKYKISLFFAVPTMYNFLLQVPNSDNFDLSSVKRCGYGAAPMPVALLEKAMKLFQNDQFYNMCGLTEGGPGGVLLLPEDHKTNMGAGGKPMLLTEARVVNEAGEDVCANQVGEFIIRSEMMMKEYYKKPHETKETLRDGWLYTGDLAIIDEEGFITLVDRKKDMIISGGENIYSAEVEQALYQHSNILEAAVVGLPDELWGEKVVAIVVSKDGEALDAEEIKAFCRNHLAKYKVPTEIIQEKAIPRNASGKILKYQIREALQIGKSLSS